MKSRMYGEQKHLNEYELISIPLAQLSPMVVVRPFKSSIAIGDKIMHPLDRTRKINREADERYLDRFGINKEYRKRVTTEVFSILALQVQVKRLCELGDISAMFLDYASKPP